MGISSASLHFLVYKRWGNELNFTTQIYYIHKYFSGKGNRFNELAVKRDEGVADTSCFHEDPYNIYMYLPPP